MLHRMLRDKASMINRVIMKERRNQNVRGTHLFNVLVVDQKGTSIPILPAVFSPRQEIHALSD